MLASRAIVGFGIGGIVVSFDLLAEYLPSQDRGECILQFGWMRSFKTGSAQLFQLFDFEMW